MLLLQHLVGLSNLDLMRQAFVPTIQQLNASLLHSLCGLATQILQTSNGTGNEVNADWLSRLVKKKGSQYWCKEADVLFKEVNILSVSAALVPTQRMRDRNQLCKCNRAGVS